MCLFRSDRGHPRPRPWGPFTDIIESEEDALAQLSYLGPAEAGTGANKGLFFCKYSVHFLILASFFMYRNS